MGQGVPQGGTLSPLLFAFVIDQVLSKLKFDPLKLSLCLYADDIFIVSNDQAYLNTILNQITTLLKSHSFKANPTKYQIVGSETMHIMVDEVEIPQSDSMKYLGVNLNCTGIDYEQEIKDKNNKILFIYNKLGSAANHLYHGKPLFVKGVVESILSYGISLWNSDQLYKLEQIRKLAINRLFGNTRKIHELVSTFYNAKELHCKARLSLENQVTSIITQLRELDTPESYILDLKNNTSLANPHQCYIALEYSDTDSLKAATRIRIQKMWNNNEATRGSQLNANSNLLKLLRKNPYSYTYSHHVLRLGIQFLSGKLPFRYWDTGTICCLCKQPYESLDHFKYECTNNQFNLSRNKLNNVFRHGTDKQIFDVLKMLKKATIGA